MKSRIALINTTRAAISPVELAFSKIWPEAAYWNLLDEGLNQLLERAGELDEEIQKRFVRLATYAADTGIEGLLFTCSAFGPAMEECKKQFLFPTLTPNEAMFEVGIENGSSIGLLASHPVTLPMLATQLDLLSKERGRDITIQTQLAVGAWEALRAGDQKSHDKIVINSAHKLNHCDVILLAQFSMAPLTEDIQSVLKAKIISSPHAAVRKIRRMLS